MATVTRTDIEAAIEDEFSTRFLDSALESSTVLAAFESVPMGKKVQNMPALSTRPEAKWVGSTAATRTKPTSKFSFENKFLTAEELAVIIVLNEEDIEDASDDLLARAAGLGGESMGRKLDQTVLFGTDKPASWTSLALFAAATAAGNIFQVGTGANDLVGSIYQAAQAVDDSGADPSGFLSRKGLTYQLANLRDSTNSPIYLPSLSASPGSVDNVAGLDAFFNKNGAWDRTKALGMVVDRKAALVGVRSDISVKFLDQATVDGVNLAENDQVALRFRARYAYVLADVMTAEGVRSEPVAAITPAPVVP